MERRVIATPLGGVEIWTEGDRVKGLHLTNKRPTRGAVESPVGRELARYFRGEPVSFSDLDVDLDDATEFEQEVYRATSRYGLDVTLVANSWMRVPNERWVALRVVGNGFDAADDWIFEHVEADDIVITSDIPLASRCLKKGARVIGPTGKSFTENNIGQAVATQDLLSELPGAGEITSGPPPLKKRDRSRFLQQLDEAVQSIRRRHPLNFG